MASGAIKPTGSLLKRGDGGGVEVFTTLAEVRGVRLTGLSANLVESTGIETAGNFRTYFATLMDGGTLAFTLNYLPGNAGHAGLLSDWKNGIVRNFQLLVGAGPAATITFAALVTALDVAVELETAVQQNVNLKVSGEPVWS